MQKNLLKILNGYQAFRKKYASSDNSIMQHLSDKGQKPEIMVIACCDSRVDPALILQCEPGDLFVVRNVANIVPPYEMDTGHHGTSAALEFGIGHLKVKHLILLGHSQCGGIQTLLTHHKKENDFIDSWMSLITPPENITDTDECAKFALNQSYQQCLTFPWINEKITNNELIIHRWFFDIKQGQIFVYSSAKKDYEPLDAITPSLLSN